jgi:Tol biopolymer transport system component
VGSLAYTIQRAGGPTLFVQPIPPTGAKYLVARGIHPIWSPDGRKLFFSPPGQFQFVSVTTRSSFTFSNPELISHPPVQPDPFDARELDITRDGKRFIDLIAAGEEKAVATFPRIDVVLNWFEDLKQRVPAN